MADTQAQQDAFALLNAQFQAYGLGTLAPVIMDYVRQGYSGDTISMLLRQTPEYQARFPAMASLAARGQAMNEVDYVNYEINARQQEAQYGLPTGMLSDPQNIARMLENNVSASDLNQRVALNAAAGMDAPPELKQTLQDYYGLDSTAALTAYYLDPEHSLDYLNQQMATAKIGAAARRQSLSLGVTDAQTLAAQGVTDAQANQAFGTVAALRGLEGGTGETVSQGTLVKAAFGDAAAQDQVTRVQKGRTAQFAQGGGASAAQQGITGLGSTTQ
jgi:hypothetical protein